MPRAAVDTLATIGVAVFCLVVGVITLTLFFRLLAWFSRTGSSPNTIAVRGILKPDTWATVHMRNADTFELVRFRGFTNTGDLKSQLPYELNGMVILEDADGCRFLVRAKDIRMIVVKAEQS